MFPAFTVGNLPGGAWDESELALPDVRARYVTITAPLNRALHLADVRIYAIDEAAAAGGQSVGGDSRPMSRRIRARAGSWRRAAARRLPPGNRP